MSSRKNRRTKRKNKDNIFGHYPHRDRDYIMSKIKRHGASFVYNDNDSLAIITWIGSTPKIKIFYYNIILWLKYVKRNIKKIMKGVLYYV
jgi:hypothetical protein